MAFVVAETVRRQLGAALFARVAGPEGPARRDRIHGATGTRWFADDRPIRTVHADASMFVGGIRALLLQSLHPLAMAGVVGHSRFKEDPWGRLQSTSHFLAVTTFGPADDAEAAVARVRRIHDRVRGVAPDGRPYAASDPRLLLWVHVAEVDSFLRAHHAYGAERLSDADYDGYVADAARIAEALGVADPPRSVEELAAAVASFRPELAGTPDARAAARFLLLRTPVPLPARPPVALLGAAAVVLLPLWARWQLRLPWLPVTERLAVRTSASALTSGIRWAMRPAVETS
jgi:uncharacterized protein (DUF2236 family)